MVTEVKSRKASKLDFKVLLLFCKVIPMLIAFVHATNNIFSYFGINDIILHYIGGVSFLTILLLYVISYTLQFCEYHRMFIHYCLITDIINWYDEYYGIPISDIGFMQLHAIIIAITMFLILYLKFFK